LHLKNSISKNTLSAIFRSNLVKSTQFTLLYFRLVECRQMLARCSFIECEFIWLFWLAERCALSYDLVSLFQRAVENYRATTKHEERAFGADFEFVLRNSRTDSI